MTTKENVERAAKKMLRRRHNLTGLDQTQEKNRWCVLSMVIVEILNRQSI